MDSTQRYHCSQDANIGSQSHGLQINNLLFQAFDQEKMLCVTGSPAAVTQLSPAKSDKKAASPGSSWALRALKQSSTKQTQMLEALLHQQLQKQLLCSSNPVMIPVPGHQVMFRWVGRVVTIVMVSDPLKHGC